MPRKEIKPKAVSMKLYWRVAATMPMPMPSTEAKKWQVSASRIVRGSRSATTSPTGLL
jgi:hypothetical protein